ncbi:Triose-phosphate Transporter family protein [Theileria parva strain Muguga]|uniref:Phosphate/phosphoenolpyruvate translocator, putative n=1 Tax=Theileria parva TaxID=5875 RepID=Q4N7V5_THEPA|nr:Triose-phosphate Transporter family protein [Theileria parva strain Muguga]EAN33953.1 Triose-phosphate Transporter family protein [Theileria parva strain Muguga]|eukprot:XP_766236.1 phosphate/phosphoenolpyruvate translocator [Theileria parva strain Muguga]
MLICTSLGQVVWHTLTVCVLLVVISATCNISRIDKPSTHFIRTSPKLCGLESLGFISNTPQINHKFLPQKYNGTEIVENYVKNDHFQDLFHHHVLPMFMERPGTHVSRVSKSDRSSLVTADFFGSRLRTLRDSVSQVSRDDLVKGATKLSMLSLLYFGKSLHMQASKKLLSLVPNGYMALIFQMLSEVPFMTLKWLVGFESPPVFYPKQYTPEKVNFKVDGVLGAVKKSLKNGVNRVKSYVMAYKTVILQSFYGVLVRGLTSSCFSYGGEGFVNFMKAMEPVFSSVLYYFMEGLKLDKMSYLSLVPVVTGVAYATYSKFTPSLNALTSSVLSFLVMYIKKDESKKFFSQNMDKVGRNLTRSNLFTSVSMLNNLMVSFFSLLGGAGTGLTYAYENVLKRLHSGDYDLLKHLFVMGLTQYMLNQANYTLFSGLSPVSAAVANSMKGVLNTLADSVFKDHKLSKQELYGSALAIAGTFLYSLTT